MPKKDRLKIEREISEYFEKRGEKLEKLKKIENWYHELAYNGYIPMINFILEMKLDIEKLKNKN